MLEARVLAQAAEPRQRPEFDRLAALRAQSSAEAERTTALCELALRGLRPMYSGAGGFVQTIRGIETGARRTTRPEGDNLRYAAIVALGLSCVEEAAQRRILRGESAAHLAAVCARRATSASELGAVAISAWAAAEAAQIFPAALLDRATSLLDQSHPIETLACAWALTAALAAEPLGDTAALRERATARLLGGQGKSNLFPHTLPGRGWARAHIGSFADQVYPIQALARLAAAHGDREALVAADACAAQICALQGAAGQWWWHYDGRDGSVVEGYPVYSVHQHAMAPMVLLDLLEAGGQAHWHSIVKGLGWLDARPETSAPLVSEADGVIWRKVGRREPAKAARKLSAITTALKPGWHLPGLDIAFPPNRVDYECRPYEFGWLLYAWRSGGTLEKLRAARAGAHV